MQAEYSINITCIISHVVLKPTGGPVQLFMTTLACTCISFMDTVVAAHGPKTSAASVITQRFAGWLLVVQCNRQIEVDSVNC